MKRAKAPFQETVGDTDQYLKELLDEYAEIVQNNNHDLPDSKKETTENNLSR